MLIFSDVLYHLASSLSPQRRAELSSVLDSNGSSPVSLDVATHVITNSNRFEGWQNVNEDVAVVTDKWVDRSMVLGKIQPTNNYSADPAMIFSGVVACATELPPPDLEVISAGITSLGGQWRTGLTRDVTHLFALSPSSQKYATAIHFQEYTQIKVLLPHWFDDAVRIGYGRLPTLQYEWPDPAVLKGPGGGDGDGQGGKMEKVTHLDREKKILYRNAMWKDIPPPAERRSVWEGRKILLSASLELLGGRREAVEAGIRRAGGIVVGGGDESVEETDVLVTRYRSGSAYVKALRSQKTIGTLTWLFHVESTGVLTAPTDQLLHYPIPKKAILGFSGHEITVTNYTGESREYLKKLITAMGAQFTPSMSGRNTVLIAAYISGNKTQKARSWSIPIVNHTWLEDCFTQWRNLTVGLEKYVVFPPGVDFAMVLGERGVRGVEADLEAELGDDDLEDEGRGGMLREEDGGDGLAMVETPRKGAGGISDSPKKTGRGRALEPVGTENSAKDVREVISVLVDDDEADVVMVDDDGINVDAGDQAGESVQVEKTPRSKGRKDMGGSGRKSARPGRDAGPSTMRRTTLVNSDEDEEVEDVFVKKSPVKAAMKPKAAPSRRPKRIDSDTDTEGDDDVPLAPVTPISKTKPKARQPTHLDTDTDEVSPPVEVPPPTRVLKSKAKKVVPPEPSTSAVQSPTRTPKRVVSVLVPPLPSHASASKSVVRTGSVRAAADEARGASSSKHNPARIATSMEDSVNQSLSALARTPSKRSAANKATRKLREEVMPDVMNYQQEMKRVKGKERERAADRRESKDGRGSTSARVGKRRSSDAHVDDDGEDEIEERPSKKKKMGVSWEKTTKGRSLSDEESEVVMVPPKKAPASEDDGSDDESSEGPPPRKTASKKTGGAAASSSGSRPKTHRSLNTNHKSIRLMTTGFTLSDTAVKVLTQLGVKMTTKPSDCTHLVAPHLVRTEKFLCALAVAPFILSDKWAEESAAAKEILPEEDYALVDPANEKKFNFKLSEALLRAKKNNGRLFLKKVFYVTPKVPIDVKLLKNVVTAGGGQVLTQTPTLRILNANRDRHIISCPADSSIWSPIAESHTIYNQELILTGALKQELDWEDKSSMVPGSF